MVQDESKWPNNSKLWALGCESITPSEIRDLKNNYTNENVFFHFDEEILSNGGGVLLDPFCYIFKSQVNNVE